MSNDTRQALAAADERKKFESWAAKNGVSAFMFTRDHIEPGCYSHSNVQGLWAAWQGALSAQPVAGAVAPDETGWLIEHSGEILPGEERRAQVGWLRVRMKFNGYGAREFGFTHDANEALRFSRREDAEAVLAMHLGASPPDWYSKPFSVTEHMWPAAPQPQAAPAPEPSAQVVAHPSHQTVREWMPVSEALRLSDLWTAVDLDNCGQWRAAIKVLADEVRALAASPRPEPSAQGEPVAWFVDSNQPPSGETTWRAPNWFQVYPGDPMWSDNWVRYALVASAPSTPPHAVVEAVPLTIRQKEDALQEFTAWFVRNYPGPDTIISDPKWHAPKVFRQVLWAIERGIAPKAAQP